MNLRDLYDAGPYLVVAGVTTSDRRGPQPGYASVVAFARFCDGADVVDVQAEAGQAHETVLTFRLDDPVKLAKLLHDGFCHSMRRGRWHGTDLRRRP